MSIRIQAVEIRVETNRGRFGRRLQFGNGLCVLWADNAMGKSTMMQAIIYSLGMEGMFGPGHRVPFGPALTEQLLTPDGAVSVRSSETLVEIHNEYGQVLTVHRQVRGIGGNHLVHVCLAPLLSNPTEGGSPEWEPYYVREGGSTTAKRGFHRLLAEFVGWSLPDVMRYDGTMVKLYMECIFPLLYIEQRYAWSYIHGRFPTYFRIKDVGAKAVEFLLGLSAFDSSRRRAQLLEELGGLRSRWMELRSSFMAHARLIDAQVDGIPPRPDGDWRAAVELRVFVNLEGQWQDLAGLTERRAQELETLATESAPKVGDVEEQLREELVQMQEELQRLERTAGELVQRQGAEHGAQQTIDSRLEAIDEDLKRYIDLRKLKRLGADVQLSVAEDSCPTCRQELPEGLSLTMDRRTPLMTVEENISFLKSQQVMFRQLQAEAAQSVAGVTRALDTTRQRVREIRATIRHLKRSLVADDRLPSEATIARRIRLEQWLEAQKRFVAETDRVVDDLESCAAEYERISSLLKSMPEGGLSEQDIRKLDSFEQNFRQQAVQYGIRSISPSEVTINRETYKPAYQDFDLQFDLSASDAIRATWAYVVALLETARQFSTNHPGLLILDEPRQQSTRMESMVDLLSRVSGVGAFGQQVIIATSEDLNLLQNTLSTIPHDLQIIDGRVLVPAGL